LPFSALKVYYLGCDQWF